MKQYLLSITTGKPNHSIWFLMDSTDYLRSNRVFDDHAEAKAAMRKSIADYFTAFKSSKADARNFHNFFIRGSNSEVAFIEFLKDVGFWS